MDANIENGYPASYAAEAIRESIVLRERELVIAPFHHKMVKYVRHLIPGVFFHFMVKRYRSNVEEMNRED